MIDMDKPRFLSTAALATLAGACSADPAGSEGSGSAQVSVASQALSAADIAQVTVSVSGPGISPTIQSDMTLSGGTWSGVIPDIPAGTQRLFEGEAFDAGASLIYAGSAPDVEIIDDQTTFVTLLLQQVAPPVSFANAVPRFTSIVLSAQDVLPGGSVDLTAGASDPDGDPLTIQWSSTAGSFSDPNTLATTWTAPLTEATYDLNVTATDPSGAQASLTASILVASEPAGDAEVTIEVNTAPEVSGLTASPTRIDAGETTALDLTAVDPDGDVLTYAWSADCSGTFSDPAAEDPTFTLTTVPAGDCTLTVDIDDGRGGTNQAALAVSTGPAPSATPQSNPGDLLWTSPTSVMTAWGTASLSDGRIVVAGESGNFGETALFDTDGQQLWSVVDPVPDSSHRQVATNSLDEIYVAGTRNVTELLVQRYLSDGSPVFDQLMGATDGAIQAVAPASSTGVVVAHAVSTTLEVFRLGPSGTTPWRQQLGGSSFVPRAMTSFGPDCFIAADDAASSSWSLFSVNCDDGFPNWEIPGPVAGVPVGVSADPAGDIIVLTAESGTNLVYRTRFSPGGAIMDSVALVPFSTMPREAFLDQSGNIVVRQASPSVAELSVLDPGGALIYSTQVGDGTGNFGDMTLTPGNDVCVADADGSGPFVACYEN